MKRLFLVLLFSYSIFLLRPSSVKAQSFSTYTTWKVWVSNSGELPATPLYWYNLSYDDSKWKSTPAPFGFEGTGDPCGIKSKLKTRIKGGSSSKPLYIYARLNLNLTKINGYSKIYIYFEGDLQEFYINGKRLLHNIRATNQCQYVRAAIVISVRGTYFRKGKNVLAVKLKTYRNGLNYFALSSSNDQCYLNLVRPRSCVKAFFGYFLSKPPGSRCSSMGIQKCDRKLPQLPADTTRPLAPNLGYWGACTSKVSIIPETCNRVDDDCNGTVDDIPSEGNYCTVSGKKGICSQGYRKCMCIPFLGKYKCNTLCLPRYKPGKEICDGKDNDCDGMVDETFPAKGAKCLTKKPGVCRYGSLSCGCLKWEYGPPITQMPADSTDPLKVPPLPKRCIKYGTYCKQLKYPTTEICDGQDNDCDGKVDESFPGMGKSCNTKRPGVCSIGVMSCGCLSYGPPIPQQPESTEKFKAIPPRPCRKYGTFCRQIYKPSTEICDGKDNDCDGKIDESFPGMGKSCNTKRPGVCSIGVLSCGCIGYDTPIPQQPESTEKFKVPPPSCRKRVFCRQIYKPSKELCDGKDNDCDGKVDEDFPTLGKPCGKGTGICAGKGKYVCKKDGTGVQCSVSGGGTPKKEVCNALDDDCDGKVDEGLERPCKNQCGSGKEYCINGNWGKCDAPTPELEICDGKDNDCNGKVDDIPADRCFLPNPPPCDLGVNRCVNGSPKCVPLNSSVKEICGNNKDDNCNGVIDDGCEATDENTDTEGDGGENKGEMVAESDEKPASDTVTDGGTDAESKPEGEPDDAAVQPEAKDTEPSKDSSPPTDEGAQREDKMGDKSGSYTGEKGQTGGGGVGSSGTGCSCQNTGMGGTSAVLFLLLFGIAAVLRKKRSPAQ